MDAKAIEEWGPFLPGAVGCLRLMSRAVESCFTTVLGLEIDCRDAALAGTPCDPTQLEAEVEAAAQAARVAVAAACTEGQLTEVGYFGFADANADLLNACVTQARAAVATTYAPAGGAPPGEGVSACVRASASYARKVLAFTLDRIKPVMERMTTRLFDPPEKAEAIRQARLELSATRQRWINALLEQCPDFDAIYGRSPESYLRTLGARADCVLSKTYINSAAVCIAQQCGNGIPEAPEQCDDGNSVDNDACRNDCTVNS